MPRPPSGFWLWIGRVLPASVRERVFEPVFYDVLADHALRRSSALSFGARMTWAMLECAGIGVAASLVQERKPTRRAWLLMGVLGITTLLLWMQASYETGQ